MAWRRIDLQAFIQESEIADRFHELLLAGTVVEIRVGGKVCLGDVSILEEGSIRAGQTFKAPEPTGALKVSDEITVLSTCINEYAEVGKKLGNLIVLEKKGRRDGRYTIYLINRVAEEEEEE